MFSPPHRPRLGEGIYSFPQVARIVGRRNGVTTGKLRRWVAIMDAIAGRPPQREAISFLDLVSVEAVRRLRHQELSFQKVRRALERMNHDSTMHGYPLAHQSILSDGQSLWVHIGDHAEEVVGKREKHTVIVEAVRTFAEEIRFADDMAASWTITPWVEIDPEVCFGEPRVRGTRIPVSTIVANLREGTPQEVADWYSLSVREVKGVAEYASVP